MLCIAPLPPAGTIVQLLTVAAGAASGGAARWWLPQGSTAGDGLAALLRLVLDAAAMAGQEARVAQVGDAESVQAQGVGHTDVEAAQFGRRGIACGVQGCEGRWDFRT